MIKAERQPGETPAGRTTIVIRRATLPAAVVAAILAVTGCARQVPLAGLLAGGADVGVIVRTVEGEEIRGGLVSLTKREMVVVAVYVEGEGVEIKGVGGGRWVAVDGARVPGDLVGVERIDGVRVARVERTLPVVDVDRATFHRSGQEVSLATILSLFLGPSVGGLLALAI
jgi:hypothetical protein